MLRILFSFLILSLLLSGCYHNSSDTYLLIKGGTLINTNNTGRDEHDLENSYILVKDSLIVEVGVLNEDIDFPDSCIELDARGKYILPGLIDGFGTINNQDYATAYIQAGVTTIVGVESARRGELYTGGDPSPDIYLMADAGDVPQTDEEIKEEFREAAENNFRVMLLMYKLNPDQLKLSLELAEKYNIATIGELGLTSYKKAADLGLESFVHVTRYSLDMAPPEMQRAVAEEPFSNDLESAKWKYYSFLSSLDTGSSVCHDHATMLGEYSGFLIPTLSLLYLDLPEHSNPWDDPLAELIDPADVNSPADRESGLHDYETAYQDAYTKLAIKQMELTNAYYRKGAKFLAGSAADVWGTMPGISLHTELELLKRAGLNKREVIATATSNFADAYAWRKGRLEKDYFADILILKSNPLENLENLRDIEILIQGGKMIYKK